MHCFSHLFSPSCQPSVEPSLWEAVLFMGVCGYLPAGVGPFLSLTHFFFLLFFFLFSSVLVPAKPFSVYRYSFRFQRAIQRGGSTQNAHTQQLSTAWWDVLPWTNSLQTLPRLPSFTSANNKRRASFPFKFFVRGGFQAMNKTTPLWILTDVKRIRQMNDGRRQESRDLTLASLFTKSRCRQTSDMGDMQHGGTFSTRKWLH